MNLFDFCDLFSSLLTSKDCGPLRQYDSDYDVMITLLSGLSLNDKPDSLLTVALAVVTSEGMIISFLLALWYKCNFIIRFVVT